MIDCSLEQVLARDRFIVTDFKGTSMNPLLKSGRDKVYIEKPKNRLKKGDIALYNRADGSYILHRVYKVLPSSYVFWGDNHFMLEYGITDDNVLGVAKGYYKGEKFIDFDKSFKYKIYKLIWCSFVSLRKFLHLFRRIWWKIKKFFSRKNKNIEK